MAEEINWAKLAEFTAALSSLPVKQRESDGVFTEAEAKILREGMMSLTRTYRDWERKPCCGSRFGHYPGCTTNA